MRPVAVVLVGLPASGKSHCTKTIIKMPDIFKSHGAEVVSGDNAIWALGRMMGKTYDQIWNMGLHKHAQKAVHKRFMHLVDKRANVIVDRCNGNLATRDSLYELLSEYDIHIVSIEHKPEQIPVLIERAKARKGSEGIADVIEKFATEHVFPNDVFDYNAKSITRFDIFGTHLPS